MAENQAVNRGGGGGDHQQSPTSFGVLQIQSGPKELNLQLAAEQVAGNGGGGALHIAVSCPEDMVGYSAEKRGAVDSGRIFSLQ